MYVIHALTITDNDRIISVKSLRVIEQGPNATVTFTPSPPEATPTVEGAAVTPNPGPEVLIEKGSAESQEAYDRARAKWLAMGIVDYELTAKIEGEGIEQEWTLRITPAGTTVISSTEGMDAGTGDLHLMLPDEQFALMADVLAGNDDPGIAVEGTDLHTVYAVRFDTQLGYPARFELRLLPGPAYDLGYVIYVKSFRRTPPE
jgi:hypothetical protein